MSLLLLKRSAPQLLPVGITQFLLIPDLAPQALYSPLHSAVCLANLWRLRRKRPYVAGSIDEEEYLVRKDPKDREFLQSLPLLRIHGADTARPIRYVGVDDLSVLLPNDEEDFLLFFPVPPPAEIPRWPHFVTDLDAVYVTLVDEFMRVETADSATVELLLTLPEFGEMPDPRATGDL